MSKTAPFAIFVNKAGINWKEENKVISQHEELKFLHKSDVFIHPCDWHNESCHRYWIGKELFLNKSMKCSTCGKYLKLSFKTNTVLKKWQTVVTVGIIALVYVLVVVAWVLWVTLSVLSAMNHYQILVNWTASGILLLLSTFWLGNKSYNYWC